MNSSAIIHYLQILYIVFAYDMFYYIYIILKQTYTIYKYNYIDSTYYILNRYQYSHY